MSLFRTVLNVHKYNLLPRRFCTFDNNPSGHKEQKFSLENEESAVTGRYQWWNTPIAINPHVHPLEEGLDYTFADGRPTPLSTDKQVERKLHQIDLGKQIVKNLDDLNKIQESFKATQQSNETNLNAYLKLKPKAKGKVPLSL